MSSPERISSSEPWHPIKFPDDIMFAYSSHSETKPWHPIKFPDDIIRSTLMWSFLKPWHPIKFPDDIIMRSARRLRVPALAPYQIPG